MRPNRGGDGPFPIYRTYREQTHVCYTKSGKKSASFAVRLLFFTCFNCACIRAPAKKLRARQVARRWAGDGTHPIEPCRNMRCRIVLRDTMKEQTTNPHPSKSVFFWLAALSKTNERTKHLAVQTRPQTRRRFSCVHNHGSRITRHDVCRKRRRQKR